MIAQGDLQRNNIIKIMHEGAWRTVMVTAVFGTFVLVTNPYTHVGVACDFDSNIHGARMSVDWLLSFGWQYVDGSAGTLLKHRKSPIILKVIEQKLFQATVDGVNIGEPFQYLHELQNMHRIIAGTNLYSPTQLKPILSVE